MLLNSYNKAIRSKEMPRKTKAINDKLLEQCRSELKNQGIRGENGRRLQAIISAKEHGIKEVAKIYNISRETLMRWIKKFKAGGVEGFEVKTGRGRRSKLSVEDLEWVKKYIEKEGAHLSALKLKLKIEENFGVIFSKASSHRLMKSLGFSYITPRPSHPKKDPQKQDEFKKKSGS